MTDILDVVESTIVDLGEKSAGRLSTEELAAELLARADGDPVRLVGPGGLLGDLTRRVLEAALEAEMSEHVGYEPYDPAGHHSGNSRNGTRSKTVITDVGPVTIEVPRDRAGTFEPQMVPKRKRRLGGVDQMVLSLSAKGLTHGEISTHLEEIYGANVSKETITRITDQVVETMIEWQNRPLDSVYPVMFIDAIYVKIRDGQVANRPIYVAIGVTVDGERDILGLWVGDGGEGAKYWAHVLTEIKNRGTNDVCILVCDGLTGLPDTGRDGVAQDHCPRLCCTSNQGVVSLRRPQGLAEVGERPQTDLHRCDRGCCFGASGGVFRTVGGQVPGYRQTVGELVGGVRAVLEFRSRRTSGYLHDERYRVGERQD